MTKDKLDIIISEYGNVLRLLDEIAPDNLVHKRREIECSIISIQEKLREAFNEKLVEDAVYYLDASLRKLKRITTGNMSHEIPGVENFVDYSRVRLESAI